MTIDRLIKIAYMITELNLGGAETMLYELVTHLNRDKYTLTVISLQDEGYFGPLLKKQGIRVIPIQMQSKWDIIKIVKLIRILKRENFDIIHSYMFHANILARTLATILRVPINISAVHTIEEGSTWHLRIDRYTKGMITHETVVCKKAQEFMRQKTKLSADKITVIYNGITAAPDIVTADMRALKARFALPETHKIIGTIGSLTKSKGHSILLEAAYAIKEQTNNVFFVIVGAGPLKSVLRHKAARLGITEHVRFIDRVVPVNDILATFDCFVLASLWEGLPIALLEAMAAKKPVVVTEAGGMGEIVQDGESGFVVPINNSNELAHSVMRIITDDNLAHHMGNYGRQMVLDRFAVDHMTAATQSLYDQLIDKFNNEI